MGSDATVHSSISELSMVETGQRTKPLARQGAAASCMAVPAVDGTMAASYLTMRGQKWIFGQHDDRFYHRRRWERSERSETTSASRIEYPNRCDWRCSHDRERCIRRVRNNSVGRRHVEIFVRPTRYKSCQHARNAQVVICAPFTTRNSLKLQGRRKAFSPFRKVRAISQRLCSQSGTTAVKSP